jgi:outer membrane receptor protein involved in Fe transport
MNLDSRPWRRHACRAALVAAFPAAAWAQADEPAALPARQGESMLERVTVTGTREKNPLLKTPAAVGIVSGKDIRFAGPMHPQQILGQVPGVAIAVTNGEGHTTAIRQPFSTSPLYLYLEDGIPTRATGFFNHNALYEVNIAQAGGIEVVRGPGTALYGSDAIGGIVNVLTRAPSSQPEASVTGEAGSFGWRRLLLDGTRALGPDDAVRADANLTHTDGWRDGTAYDRHSANLRWDHDIDGHAGMKTLLSVTHIDQQTGANSPLVRDDYLHHPTRNNFMPAYRKVDALRLSTQYEHEAGPDLLSVTPYLRSNEMDLNGSYNMSFDPRIEKTEVASLGVMLKWRHDFNGAWKPRLITGVDLEHSPGTRTENSLMLVKTGSGAQTVYTGYAVGGRIYDYDVDFKSRSAYLHGEVSPIEGLRLTAGLRHDTLSYDMTNHLTAGASTASGRFYGQLASAAASYSHLSPKLGLTFALSPASSLYASWNHGFRAPSENQLFRAGSAASPADAQNKAQLALALKPIKASQVEIGVRGEAQGWGYDLVVYDLRKRDDLVSQRDLATNVTTNVNAGRTDHRGVELGLGKSFNRHWRLDAALSYAKHRYVEWITASADYSGHEMESAPRVLVDTRVTWTPSQRTSAQLEWVRIGAYWLEAGNSPTFGKYPGHDVFNLRVNQAIGPQVKLFARIMNLTDKRYADSASVSSNTAVFSPALPRSCFAGMEVTW